MIRRVLLGISVFLFLSASAVTACTCSKEPPGVCPGLHTGDVVFLGTVLSAEQVSPAGTTQSVSPTGELVIPSAVTRYHFHIDERFAGPAVSEIDIFSGGDDADCGYVFKSGAQYVVFTNPEAQGRLFATICNGTRPVADARALLPQLRAMSKGEDVASVFGVIRRSDPPLLAPPNDPDDPVSEVPLKLRSRYDRFSTATDDYGVYSFYGVHAGKYVLTARLPARMELSERTVSGPLPPIEIPEGACYEFNIDALPTGKIRGSVLAANGKPLPLASVELYRAGHYADSQPGLWGFQSEKGFFEFSNIGPGDYLLVFNRLDRSDPNSPYPRTFYPGVTDASDTRLIRLKDGQNLEKVNIRLGQPYPTRTIRVQLKWMGGRVPGDVYVTAHADEGVNPAARKIGDDLYEFTILKSARYTFTAGEDPDPGHPGVRGNKHVCVVPAHIDSPPVAMDGSDQETKQITLEFPSVPCGS
ncbi:MAG TPA: hypothetical protein VMU43_00620 [Candidatus Acidoferrum sp.]|nr:hypothetical protein [Candidatus Acidoferrum sp.]